ncbi:MAG TPA: hypothetical protein VHT27_05730 [Solirubrobacteraceae bacterium]|nr:hypothetical protein [Solirubrobacteraceae bacterium]
MAQISRPIQIALGVFLVVAAAWFIALRPKSNNETHASSTPSPSASSSQHIAAPGVQGLVKDVNKAKHAVAVSQNNAKQLQQSSEAASSSTGGTAAQASTAPAHTSTAPAHTSTTTRVAVAPAVKSAKSSRGSIKAYAGAGRQPSRQVLVETALNEGKPAVIVLWNKHGSDDQAVKFQVEVLEFVHHVIRKLPKKSGLVQRLRSTHMYLGPFAAFFSEAKSVAEFGSITRGIQVFGTPTVIVVAKNHPAKVLTGLTDAFSLQQAIEEARSA